MGDKIQNDMKDAMRAKDELTLSVLRMLLSTIHNREIEKRAKSGEEKLTDEEIAAAIRSEAKKRKDAITEFEKGGREDLVKKETAELKILEKYLPQEISDEEVENIAKEAVAATGAASPKDFGRAMGEAMKRAKGQASGDRMGLAVKRILGA